jgi:23S rRNA G2069 N7-methylase RlmK/C1962 C5-methylase RlmI
MRLIYKYNETKMELKETQNEEDVEFNLTFFDKEVKKQLQKVKQFFNENDISTDLLVYTHSDKHVQIIVRKDFYYDFVLQLFKYQLLEEVKWD